MGGQVDRSRAFPTATASGVGAAPFHPARAMRGPRPVGTVAGADRGPAHRRPFLSGRAGPRRDILGHGRTSRAACRAACRRAGPGGGAALVGLPAAPGPRRADRGAGRGRRLLLRPGRSAAARGAHRLPARHRVGRCAGRPSRICSAAAGVAGARAAARSAGRRRLSVGVSARLHWPSRRRGRGAGPPRTLRPRADTGPHPNWVDLGRLQKHQPDLARAADPQEAASFRVAWRGLIGG